MVNRSILCLSIINFYSYRIFCNRKKKLEYLVAKYFSLREINFDRESDISYLPFICSLDDD